MSRRTHAQLDADALRSAAAIFRAYGIPASANVCKVVADSIESGNRKKVTS